MLGLRVCKACFSLSAAAPLCQALPKGYNSERPEGWSAGDGETVNGLTRVPSFCFLSAWLRNRSSTQQQELILVFWRLLEPVKVSPFKNTCTSWAVPPPQRGESQVYGIATELTHNRAWREKQILSGIEAQWYSSSIIHMQLYSQKEKREVGTKKYLKKEW